MSKKTEALKLALEALEYIHEGANNQGPHTGISWRCVSNKAEPAITAIREALADSALDRMAENARELGLDYEPAQKDYKAFYDGKKWYSVEVEPPCKTGSQCTSKCQQCEHPAQQQEPVAAFGNVVDRTKAYDAIDRFLRNNLDDSDYSEYSAALEALYTSPQPAQPSKPLTDEQRKAIVVCFTSGKVSVSEVQRKLAISYNEAQQLCQSIVDLKLAQGLQLAPSLDRHGIKGDA